MNDLTILKLMAGNIQLDGFSRQLLLNECELIDLEESRDNLSSKSFSSAINNIFIKRETIIHNMETFYQSYMIPILRKFNRKESK